MRRFFQIECCILGLLSIMAPAAQAGFDFSVFRLRTLSQDRTGPSIVSDVESIDSPQTPVHVLQETGFGPNISQTQYDVSWLDYTGTFNAALNQHIEEPDFLTSMERRLDFAADVDLLVDVDISIDFSSSSADQANIQGGFRIDGSGGTLTFHFFRGGASTLDPASGTFALTEQFLLPAGDDYVIRFTMRGESGSVVAPMNAPIEISGYSNLSIMPVPEPHSALLLAFAAAIVLPRRRFRCHRFNPSPTDSPSLSR